MSGKGEYSAGYGFNDTTRPDFIVDLKAAEDSKCINKQNVSIYQLVPVQSGGKKKRKTLKKKNNKKRKPKRKSNKRSKKHTNKSRRKTKKN